MLQPLIDWIEKFATDFSWKRLVIFITLLFLFCGGLGLYEAITSKFRLEKYEKVVTLIEKIQGLQIKDKISSQVIDNINNGLLEITQSNQNLSISDLYLGDPLKQALAASGIWLILSLFYIPGFLRGDLEARNSLIGFWALGFLIGGVGYLLPTGLSDWIRFGLYPVGFNLFMILFIALIGNRKNNQNS